MKIRQDRKERDRRPDQMEVPYLDDVGRRTDERMRTSCFVGSSEVEVYM
jgi:hypothetical protein